MVSKWNCIRDNTQPNDNNFDMEALFSFRKVPTIFRYAGIFFLFVVTYFIFDYLQIETISNLKQLIISSLYVFLICTVLTFGVFYLLFHGTRDFVSRLVTMFKRNNS